MRESDGCNGTVGSEAGETLGLNDLGFKSRWGLKKTQARLDATEEKHPSTSAPLTRSDESKDSPSRDADAEYHRSYQREWIAERRARFFSGKSCCLCGATKNLELDHLDPATKVSHKVWSWSEERRAAEIAKCRVVCEPCHRERHAEERRKSLVHGTRNAYRKRGCRCAICRRWNADYAMERKRILALPPERTGRALVAAFCLAFLAGVFSGCETRSPATSRCLRLCSGAVHQLSLEWSGASQCECEQGCPDTASAADGGRP